MELVASRPDSSEQRLPVSEVNDDHIIYNRLT